MVKVHNTEAPVGLSSERRISRIRTNQVAVAPVATAANPSHTETAVESIALVKREIGLVEEEQEVTRLAAKIVLDRDKTKANINHRHREKQALCSIVNFSFFIGIYFSTVIIQLQVKDSYDLEGAMTDYLVGGHTRYFMS